MSADTPPPPVGSPATGAWSEVAPDAALGRIVVGVGVDLVDVERIRRAVQRSPGFVHRVFTEGEQARADAARDPAERYAVRWAAKEATLKALGVGLGAAPLTAIEVVRLGSGAPRLVVHGRAAEVAAERGVAELLVSMSHTATVAQATVLALGA